MISGIIVVFFVVESERKERAREKKFNNESNLGI